MIFIFRENESGHLFAIEAKIEKLAWTLLRRHEPFFRLEEGEVEALQQLYTIVSKHYEVVDIDAILR